MSLPGLDLTPSAEGRRIRHQDTELKIMPSRPEFLVSQPASELSDSESYKGATHFDIQRTCIYY